MADYTEDDTPPPAPVFPPKAAREAVIIEGEAREVREPVGEPASVVEPEPAPEQPAGVIPEAAAPEAPPGARESVVSESPAAAPAPRRGLSVGLGLGGAVIGAAAALAAAWYFDPRAGALNNLAARVDADQAAVTAESQNRKALDSRLIVLEGAAAASVKASDLKALEQRLAKLEAAPAVSAAALAAVQAEARAAREAADKALAGAGPAAVSAAPATSAAAPGGAAALPAVDLSAIEARLARLESATTKPDAPPPSPAPDPRIAELEAAQQRADQAAAARQGALEARLAKIEAALATPKAETRVAPDEAAPRPDLAAQGVAALALEQRLVSGQPFAVEWAALSRLGADAAALAALKPFADGGAPSASALSAGFAKVLPAALAAAEPAVAGGILDKLTVEAGRMVKVHPVGEVPGDDPQAVATQIQAALARGQVDAAVGLWRKWPESARKASAEWGRSAEGRAGADAAAKTLRESALARLAPTKN